MPFNRNGRLRICCLAASMAAALGVATGCGSGGVRPRAQATSRRADGHTCIPAALQRRAPPSWARSAGVSTRYALTADAAAAAFFFAYPLRAGHPNNPANKILWVMRWPREGKALSIVAKSADDPGRRVQISQPADSGPGEIYPTIVDLPTPGCWTLTLNWSSHTTRIAVVVRPRTARLVKFASATSTRVRTSDG